MVYQWRVFESKLRRSSEERLCNRMVEPMAASVFSTMETSTQMKGCEQSPTSRIRIGDLKWIQNMQWLIWRGTGALPVLRIVLSDRGKLKFVDRYLNAIANILLIGTSSGRPWGLSQCHHWTLIPQKLLIWRVTKVSQGRETTAWATGRCWRTITIATLKSSRLNNRHMDLLLNLNTVTLQQNLKGLRQLFDVVEWKN